MNPDADSSHRHGSTYHDTRRPHSDRSVRGGFGAVVMGSGSSASASRVVSAESRGQPGSVPNGQTDIRGQSAVGLHAAGSGTRTELYLWPRDAVLGRACPIGTSHAFGASNGGLR